MVPPDAASVVEYPDFILAAGTSDVEIANGAALPTENVNCLLAICGGASESFTSPIMVYVPDVFGVPETTPADESVSPSGSEPEGMLQA